MGKIEQRKPVMISEAPKRVAAYVRVSCDKDAMLHSFSAQISYYSEMIQWHSEWEFVGVYADEAFTGTKDNRPEYQRLIADCRAGKIDLVITKSISRFARNTVDLLEVVRELKTIGVDIFFEKENIHSISNTGELMLTILASFAQEESLSVSENCKWRIRSRFADGEPVNLRSFFGYHIENSVFHIVPEEAGTVRFIFDSYLAGSGICAIMKQVEQRGIRLSRNGIAGVLRNEKYTGDLLLQKYFSDNHLTKRKRPNRGELPQYYVTDHHEAIISKELFDAVQAEISHRAAKHPAPQIKRPLNAFSGLIRCGICGGKYHRTTAVSNGYARPVWKCRNYDMHGKAACASQQIPEKVLLEQTALALGLTEFKENEFKKQISEIVVPGHHRLAFCFKAGRRDEREWHTSRRDSWTPEMKEAARRRQLDINEQRGTKHE